MLHTFFCGRVQELLQRIYPSIYPVYGGGDDLYLIGPWDRTLALAVLLREEFQRDVAGGKMTFSAGFALGKPHHHILTKSDEAAALEVSKDRGRDRMTALGVTAEWTECMDEAAGFKNRIVHELSGGSGFCGCKLLMAGGLREAGQETQPR